MLRIRLRRVGKRNDPSFRMVVIEKGKPAKAGNPVENLGSYNPRNDEVSIDEDRVKYWISNGAKPSDTVHNILVNEGIIKADKINVLPRKSPIVPDVDEEENQKDVKEEGGVPPNADDESGDNESKTSEDQDSESTDSENTSSDESTEAVESSDKDESSDKGGKVGESAESEDSNEETNEVEEK